MSGFVADSQGHTTSGPTITWREYEGLLARVRELEAQAEIAEAAVEWLKIAGWLGDRDEDGDAEDRAFCRLCQLAAPAARKEVE